MSVVEIGCCGAYCKTCPEFKNSRCQGCKIGYANGKRDIAKAKCTMKICCMEKGHDTCADCDTYSSCGMIQSFYSKKGYKYSKYKEATLFIRDKGYGIFLRNADSWKSQYGKYR
jgi:hypothetical protein